MNRTANNRAIWMCLALVSLVYLIQLPTPLRVNTDGITYLTLAASFNDGHGFMWHGHKAHFPSGYPAVVATLERIGLGTSAGLVGWNIVCLAFSIVCGIWLLQRWLGLRKNIAALIALIYLLSWATVRYTLIPGSEMTYIAVSFLCLVCLNLAEEARTHWRWVFWICAVVLIPLAMSVRLVGVVLPLAVLWSLVVILWRLRKSPQVSLHEWLIERKAILINTGIAALILAGAFAWAVSRTSYFHEDVSLMLKQGVIHEMLFTMKQRCIESASMMLNIPSKNVLLWLHWPLAFIGIPCLALILFVVARRIRSLTSIDVYLIGYIAILLIWPYDADVRFWLPVQLLLYGVIARELLDLKISFQKVLIPLIGYAILGVASIAWNTKITYSGDQFSEFWDLRGFRDTYRVALKNGLPVDPEKVDRKELLPALERFGSRDFKK